MSIVETPVMRQYREIKAAHPGTLVFFRMGDFYEMFGDDAVLAAELLQITLTKRRTARPDDPGIPMCGVPYHAAEGYIGKLIAEGQRVALVEQTESPEEAKKARGSSALVTRSVVRVFTPGTLTEEAYLGEGAKLLAAVMKAGKDAHAVAWLDLAGGECGVEQTLPGRLPLILARLPLGEVLVDEASHAQVAGLLPVGVALRVEEHLFKGKAAAATVRRAYHVAQLDGLGLQDDEATTTALGALLGYAELTQVGQLPPLRAPQLADGSGETKAKRQPPMALDAATRRNLELTESTGGQRKNSLLGVIDRSMTGPGKRLLARWLAEPLTDVVRIHARQGAVAALVNDGGQRQQLRTLLGETGDVARAVSRLLLGRGSPRDLLLLKVTGEQLPELREMLAQSTCGHLQKQVKNLQGLDELTVLLKRALRDEREQPLPALVRDGGFIGKGFDAELEAFRDLVDHGNDKLAALEQQENAAAGATSGSGKELMKLRYNQVWGYFFELSKAQLEKGGVPGHFVHRQTTTNAHRYTTPALMTLERDLAQAGANAQRREVLLFEELVGEVRKHSVPLLDTALALASVDALASLAEVAARKQWFRPTVDETTQFDIVGGKHPVVADRVADFIANNCTLGGGQSGRLWLLTGPNMAGKSTFLRQNALLAVLAQIGSYVPAERAHIGVCDAIYSRIGAGDNLAAGQSTFMVEMVETAQILNRATERSLVILDELGRGTATYDGLAIAWACVEELAARTQCRTLFATHYHELTTLAESPEFAGKVSIHQVAVKPWQGEIVFLHQVIPGAAQSSFGVQVAKLAGVPSSVVQRADALLKAFEKTAGGDKGTGIRVARVKDLALFDHAPTNGQGSVATPSEVEKELSGMVLDELSPKQAWEELHRLKEMLN